MTLNKENLYQIYQNNLLGAENQLSIIEEICKQKRAQYYISKCEKHAANDYISSTRLYALLLANWFEVKLFKIINENSSAAFKPNEVEQIQECRSISEKWQATYKISIEKIMQKGLNNFDNINIQDLSNIFQSDYFIEIENLIQIRNKLAHGQWNIQLNHKQTNINNSLKFLDKYQSYSHLKLLRSKLEKISKIIETIVIYKDKENKNFSKILNKLKNEIDNIDSRLNNINDEKNSQTKINQLLKIKSITKNYYNQKRATK
ncbi:hypothetical protein [Neisseria zalophi]|uniref:RiboL-PSP-HEPN domain-containing protein n=1 Tax=Neisseria zalophi TaxID=640030 RepID=A0A5J6PVV1_9NEIS|nr:hypothetical protein [Neisseria zalophi]QEY26384.1 hypothetical protein D0T92_07485 [Neisseria zalophi]